MAEAVLSQLAEHAPFGGVVPEIAARAHLRYLPEQVRNTIAQAGIGFSDLGGVAATSGPGLIGGLIVGCQFGKGIAIANELPFVAVNHLEAHALTARLPGIDRGRRAVSLPVAAVVRRPFAVHRGQRRRAVHPARRHRRRRGGRGIRQGRQAAGTGLAGRTGAGKNRRRRRSVRLRLPAPDAPASRMRPEFLRPEDRGGADGAPNDPGPHGSAASRHRGQLPASGGRCPCRPGGSRDGDDARALSARQSCWSSPAAWRRTRPSAPRLAEAARSAGSDWSRRPSGFAPTTR